MGKIDFITDLELDFIVNDDNKDLIQQMFVGENQ